MNNRQTRLLHRIEKAGIRQSLREGHLLSEDELLNTKVQILPNYARIMLGISGLCSGLGAYQLFINEHTGWGIFLAILSILLLLFAAFGVKRTLSGILDSLDAAISAELLGAAIEGIASAVGSIFDGV